MLAMMYHGLRNEKEAVIMNSTVYQWGILVGVIVGLVIVAIIFMYNKKTTGTVNGGDFDERQQLLRGKAFQKGFFTMMIFSAAYWALVQLILRRPLMEDGVSGLACLFAGIAVFAMDCILHDAFFTVKNKPKSYIALFAVCTLCQIPAAFANIREGRMVRDGVLSFGVIPVLSGATFLAVLIAIIIQQARPEKDED